MQDEYLDVEQPIATGEDCLNVQAGDAIQELAREIGLTPGRCVEIFWNICRGAGISEAMVRQLIENARSGNCSVQQTVKAIAGLCGLCAKWKSRGAYVPLAENESRGEFICSKCQSEVCAHLLLGRFATKWIRGLNGNGSDCQADIVDSQGLADELGVTREAVRQWRNTGRIPYERLTDRKYLYSKHKVKLALSSEGG